MYRSTRQTNQMKWKPGNERTNNVNGTPHRKHAPFTVMGLLYIYIHFNIS